jgi:outer membrane receptor protein involved in Fe transport
VKFRANNAWAVNWGSTAFPAGTGTPNGPDIPIATAGSYTVQLDDVTGAYQFTLATATASKMGSVIGDVASLKLSLAPNPTNGAVSVTYELPAAATASIAVQNLLGQSVRQFAQARQSAG